MPSEHLLSQVNWQRRTEPGDLPEWMDEPCSYEEFRACLRDLGQVNKLTRGYKPTLSFLDQAVAQRGISTPLRILDVGFGGGDALHRIAQWSRRRGIAVQLTGIDLNPYAARAAQERFGDSEIRWLVGDALAYEGQIDVVISSLLTHHLASEQVVQFLRWMEANANVGWFINDLERSARSASLFSMLASIMRWHRFVRHDGPVSFARAFKGEDWQHMLTLANVPAASTQIAQSFPSRLCVGRLK